MNYNEWKGLQKSIDSKKPAKNLSKAKLTKSGQMVMNQGSTTAKNVQLHTTDWFEYPENSVVYFANVNGVNCIWHQGHRIV